VYKLALIDISKYPFIISLEKALSVKYPGLKLENILNNPDLYPYTRSLEILRSIISKGVYSDRNGLGEDEVIAFYTLIIGAKSVGERSLINRIAVAVSKHVSSKLVNESLETIVGIAKRIGLNAEIPDNPPKIPLDVKSDGRVQYMVKPVGLDLRDYLKVVVKRLAREPKYSLVNQIVDKSIVYLDREVFIRVLEEAVYNYILDLAEKLDFNIVNTKYIEDFKKVLEETGWFKSRGVETEDFKPGELNIEALPPCMSSLITRLKNGENLSHHERFTVAAFLANIGLDTEEILEFFKNTPDFNEKIARYQIEHISGQRGSRKKYLPYRCDNMKSLNICPVSDYCNGGKNPLAVYKYNLRGIVRRRKMKNNVQQGKVEN